MTAFTPERIAELRALWQMATRCPWVVIGASARELRGPNGHLVTVTEYASDAAFIASASTALPEALAEIERLHEVEGGGILDKAALKRALARIAELEGLLSHTACTIDIWNSADSDGDTMEQVLVDTSGMLKTALGGDPTKDARDQPEILRHLPERAQ